MAGIIITPAKSHSVIQSMSVQSVADLCIMVQGGDITVISVIRAGFFERGLNPNISSGLWEEISEEEYLKECFAKNE